MYVCKRLEWGSKVEISLKNGVYLLKFKFVESPKTLNNMNYTWGMVLQFQMQFHERFVGLQFYQMSKNTIYS